MLSKGTDSRNIFPFLHRKEVEGNIKGGEMEADSLNS